MNKREGKLLFTDEDKGGVIHVANIKGGVGKSTIATNLAYAFAKHGTTLIVDLDVQGSASQALGRDPTEFKFSSWNLFSERFKPLGVFNVNRFEKTFFPHIFGKNDIDDIIVKVTDNLDLIPANSDLFKNFYFYNYSNFKFNLSILRKRYKYVIVDTPSVWNSLTKLLYIESDLNLVPVTLNALSTKSLRNYLISVKDLAVHSNVRIRILKNEVFGKTNSKLKGKTRTMNENRKFLDSMCEQIPIHTNTGISILPQKILLDVEIPDSAVIRDAQDSGLPVQKLKQYSSVSKAFEKLYKNIQYVLNSPYLPIYDRSKFLNRFVVQMLYVLTTLVIVVFFTNSAGFVDFPSPVVPQSIKKNPRVFTHYFNNGESLLRIAKYAICKFTATVPSMKQIDDYAIETIRIYNSTKPLGAKKITYLGGVPSGSIVTFYEPTNIPVKKNLLDVYDFFSSIVDDKYAYVTGDWCDRGMGGGNPHYGIDVAAALGSKIIAPFSGTVVTKNGPKGGHMLGIVADNEVIFFAHMEKRYFKQGFYVKKGTPVGEVGMTGHTTGPHVHVGYGIRSVGVSNSIKFGRNFYKLTDPKLCFYRQQYLLSEER